MMNLAEVAQAVHGQLSPPQSADMVFQSVSTDTREALQGKLFIALRGERFDAHDYLAQAAGQGAVAAVVDKQAQVDVPANFPLIRVDNTRVALGLLGSHWRSRFSIPLIGVTGSNGKTTVKEMCAAILRAWLGQDAVLATQGNLNNDIGLPQMLLRLHGGIRAAVIEMGMNHPGEITWLAGLARPTVSIVTNAQRAHLEGMGQLQAVAAEKGEIYRVLGADGVAIINADDEHAGYWRTHHGAGKILDFGVSHPAEVTAQYSIEGLASSLVLSTPLGKANCRLSVPGIHNIRNALGAAAAALAAGAPLEAIVKGLGEFGGAKGRLQSKPAIRGATLLDDTYNANPDSVRAGIDVLMATPGRKYLVLGDMGEIGDMSAQYHDEIGGYAKSAGVDRLFALGEQSVVAARNFGGGGQHFNNVEALLTEIVPLLDKDVVVLVKGSRFMRMERVVEGLAPPQNEN
jgi:UDP-N-acetylmuramoyl-tripeptide--D-alanyl-D-alanine ligase